MRRSRLTPEREAELYDAVLDLLREVGYDALTMDAVAARTHSSKATLYRQWGGKPELVAKALRHSKPVAPQDIDTGSAARRLRRMISARPTTAQMAQDSALMRGLGQAVHDNPELHQALRELLIDPEMTGLGGDAAARRRPRRDRRGQCRPRLRPPHADRRVRRPSRSIEDRCRRPGVPRPPTSTPWSSPPSASDPPASHPPPTTPYPDAPLSSSGWFRTALVRPTI